MSLRTNRFLQITLFFIDSVIITVVLYEITVYWLGGGVSSLNKAKMSGEIDIRSSPADAALELVMKKRGFTYVAAGKRDPFKSLLIPKEPPKQPDASKPVSRPVTPSFKLKGIIWDLKDPVAYLDIPNNPEKSMVRVGTEIDNYKVIKITKNTITLTSGQFNFVLKIEEQKRAGERNPQEPQQQPAAEIPRRRRR